MYWQSNKMLVASLLLATAGILTCIAALFDIFVPKWSFLAFLGTLILLGLVVAGILGAFVWVCEKCDGYRKRRVDTLLNEEPPIRPVLTERELCVREFEQRRRNTPQFPRPDSEVDRYTEGFRGSAKPNASSSGPVYRMKNWHGQ